MLKANENRRYDYADWEGVWEGYSKGDWEGMVGEGLAFELPPIEQKVENLLTKMGLPPTSRGHAKGFASVFVFNVTFGAPAKASNPASNAKDSGF
jgi:hypothetical protein